MKVANEFKSKVMNYAIASKDDYSKDFDSLGLKPEGDDPIVSVKSDDGSKYAMKEKFRYPFTANKVFFLNLLLLSKKNACHLVLVALLLANYYNISLFCARNLVQSWYNSSKCVNGYPSVWLVNPNLIVLMLCSMVYFQCRDL